VPGDWIALAAIGASAGTVFWTTRSADKQRRASELEAARKEAASVMGPVRVLLTELDPLRWTFTAGPGAPARVEEIRMRWEPTRTVLAGISAGYPTDDVRETAEKLDVAIHNSYVSSCMWGQALPAQSGPWTMEKAVADHAEAQRLADDLAAKLRGQRSSKKSRKKVRRDVTMG
jgi:hypothetical protein